MKGVVKKYFGNSIIEVNPDKYSDKRGYFMELYRNNFLKKNGISEKFKQENISLSKKKYTFRGLHFQTYPKSQSKLVSVLNGKIIDIIVDLRRFSKTYGRHIKIKLDSKNIKLLYIPVGFAHGFLTLENNTVVSYKVSEYYSPKNEKTLSILDKNLKINLGVSKNKLIISNKDLNGIEINRLINIKF